MHRINGQSHGNLEVLVQTTIHRINEQSHGNLEVLVQTIIHRINGQSHGNLEVLVPTTIHRNKGQSHGNLEVLVKRLVSLQPLEPMPTQYADFSYLLFYNCYLVIKSKYIKVPQAFLLTDLKKDIKI